MTIVSQPANNAYRDHFDEVFKKSDPPSSDLPRRIRAEAWSTAERAISAAMRAVEAMPADVRLTQAVVLLGQAKDKVADFIDGIGRCAKLDCTAQPLPGTAACSDHY